MSTRSSRKRSSGAASLALALGAALLPTAGQAQTVEWARSDGGTSADRALGIDVDAVGNSHVTGSFRGTATFGPFTLTTTGGQDIFVAKYDSSGTVVWTESAGGTLPDRGQAIAVDAAGNSFVTGVFHDTATFGPFTLDSTGGLTDPDVFVAKYDGNGNVLWAQSAGGTSNDEGAGIAVDTAGNSYVTGFYVTTAIFGPFTLISAGGSAIFVVKYDSSGNVLWARSAGGPVQCCYQGYGIAVDADGNSYVTGRFSDTATFGSVTLTGGGFFVTKYDTDGNVLWARSAGGVFSEGRAIAVDGFGNSYVTGRFSITAIFGPFTLTSAPGEEIFVVNYDSSGNVLWASSAGGTADQRGVGIAVDADRNSYVTGFFRDTASFGPFPLTSVGSSDIFVAKYDPSGTALWARSAGGINFDDGQAIAVDAAGNAYATGAFHLTATFGSFTLTGAGSNEVFLAKYAEQPCGNGVCDPREDSCDCPDDCGTPAQIEIPGSTCTDGLDNDCDGDADCRDSDCDDDPACEGVPTVSQWGMAVLLVALLLGIALKFRRSRTT